MHSKQIKAWTDKWAFQRNFCQKYNQRGHQEPPVCDTTQNMNRTAAFRSMLQNTKKDLSKMQAGFAL